MNKSWVKKWKIITKNKKYEAIIDSLLGTLPQCGFSSMASNLYSSKVITNGTLIAVLFILIANILINKIIYKVGKNNLSNILLHKNIFTYFIVSLIGLILNYASSIIITELYLSKLITISHLLEDYFLEVD